MNFEVNEDTKEGVLQLIGELTLLQAEELKMHLTQALEASEHLCIDTEMLTDIDLACLQLICSTHRSAAKQGKLLALTPQGSEVFMAKVKEAGLLRGGSCGAVDASDCLWKGGE